MKNPVSYLIKTNKRFTIHINFHMKQTLAILFAILVVAHASNMGFQTGSDIATLVRGQNGRYYGQYDLQCVGGQAPYRINLTNLPNGWTLDGNTLIIPDIINMNNFQTTVAATITDSAGQVFNGNVQFSVNGVNIRIQNAASGATNRFGAATAPSLVGTGSSSNAGVNVNVNGGISGGISGGVSGGISTSTTITSLYESYPGLAAGTNVVPSSGVFPVPASPSGLPRTANVVPTVIRESQATYNVNRDSKTITIDDVKQTAAFNRQLNANKGVANLISIIQQLTANVNAAKADIVILEQNLATAEAANRQCNNIIFDLANARTKIENAIKDRQSTISEVNAKISNLTPMLNDLIATRNTLVQERTAIENQKSPNAARLAQLERELTSCIAMKEDLMSQLNDLRDEISGIRAQIQITREEAAGAPAAIEQIDSQIPIVDARIAELRRQISEAEAEKVKLQNDRVMYQTMIRESEQKIANFNRQITTLEARIPGLEREISTKQANCDRIQAELDQFRNELSENDANFQILTQQINTQNGLIDDKRAEIQQLRDTIANIPNEIVTLQAELNRVANTLSRQYYICNDAADGVRVAKQNLEAMQLKFTTESAWLKEANGNLEKARAEKELADLAVQEIIAASTEALPFAIVPNGQGQTPVGTPVGNNAAGSALGAVRQVNQIVPGSPIVVGDLKYYLSSAYGAGVDVTKSSSVTTLYPLSSLTLEAITGASQAGVFNPDGTFITGNNYSGSGSVGGGRIPESYLGQFSCNGSNNIVQGQGKVLGVQPGMIRVQTNGGSTMNLSVGSCSSLYANAENLTMVPFMDVYYKAAETSNGYNLHELTTIV